MNPAPVGMYVSNGSSKSVSFDNILVKTMYVRTPFRSLGQVRQMLEISHEGMSADSSSSRHRLNCGHGGANHYYPYDRQGARRGVRQGGLSISGIDGEFSDYLNKYTGKELQTGEFNATASIHTHSLSVAGLEMFDFHARFYDPQLGRWFTPDPATERECARTEQFSNPYLAMGNNPVMYVDPDGRWIWAPIIIGAAISGAAYTVSVATSDGGFANWNWGQFALSVGIGAASGAAGAAVGGMTANAINTGYFTLGIGSNAVGSVSGFFAGAAVGASSGLTAGFVSGSVYNWANGGNLGSGLKAGLKAGGWGALTGGVVGGVTGGIDASRKGKDFFTGGEKARVYRSPIADNFGNQNGECALRCFEEFSESYGFDQLDYDYWFKQNGSKLGVLPNDVKDIVESSDIFGSERFGLDMNKLTNALENNERIMAGFNTGSDGAHAVMVNRVKLWPNGNYRIWFSETSPQRIAPYSIKNFFEMEGLNFWSFFMK